MRTTSEAAMTAQADLAGELLTLTGAPPSIRWEIGGAGFDELFRLYTDAGFIYPAKLAALMPLLPSVRENWQRTALAGTGLHWTANARSERGDLEASVSTWRSTMHSWVGQHLVSRGIPGLSGGVLLLAQRTMIDLGCAESHQYWFQPTNRFANRTFGSAARILPPGQTVLRDTALCTRPLAGGPADPAEVRLVECGQHDRELTEFARAACGSVFAAAEDLECGDTMLTGVDDLYRRVGLRRQRRVWLAYHAGAFEPSAALLAYRGPLGLNFSFIENRSEIILAPWLSPARSASVTAALAGLAGQLVGTFTAAQSPLVVPPQAIPFIEELGGQMLRSYRQSICLKDGFYGWHSHMERFYQRIAGRAGPRIAEQGAAPAAGRVA
jgi:hypothetical protein